MQAMEPGSLRGLQLVVADAAAAREDLISSGVEASEITTFDERDGGTFFGFADPDGNTWAVQQLMVRAERPLIPPDRRRRFGDQAASTRPRTLKWVIIRCGIAFTLMIAYGLGLAWIGDHRGRARHGGSVRRSCGDPRTQES
jgi:hypothetical protein